MINLIPFLLANLSGGAAVAQRQDWGRRPDGQSVYLYTLTNASGMEARITNFGGILVSLKVPGREGKLADVVLGFDTLDEYVKTRRYFGATVGRFANRIAKAQFQLEGRTYHLPANNGENTLHGGTHGFHKSVWASSAAGSSVRLKLLSPDGEDGFPGNLEVEVVYTLTDRNELRIDYSATTDKPTVINLTNHSFFNLAGEGNGNVLDHVVRIDADRITPVRAGLIPTGELRSVGGIPFDFRKPAAIGSRIHQPDPQLEMVQGFDHNFVLNHRTGHMGPAAHILDPHSGRVLEVRTTEPGLQFFTANTLDGSGGGKGGKSYGPNAGFCVETQHFPDSPNQAGFPSTELQPGRKFHSTTVFRFGTEARPKS